MIGTTFLLLIPVFGQDSSNDDNGNLWLAGKCDVPNENERVLLGSVASRKACFELCFENGQEEETGGPMTACEYDESKSECGYHGGSITQADDQPHFQCLIFGKFHAGLCDVDRLEGRGIVKDISAEDCVIECAKQAGAVLCEHGHFYRNGWEQTCHYIGMHGINSMDVISYPNKMFQSHCAVVLPKPESTTPKPVSSATTPSTPTTSEPETTSTEAVTSTDSPRPPAPSPRPPAPAPSTPTTTPSTPTTSEPETTSTEAATSTDSPRPPAPSPRPPAPAPSTPTTTPSTPTTSANEETEGDSEEESQPSVKERLEDAEDDSEEESQPSVKERLEDAEDDSEEESQPSVKERLEEQTNGDDESLVLL